MFILTLRNDRLGDLILALPTVSALRERYPGARLGLLVAPAAAGVLELYPQSVECWLDDDDHRKRLFRDRPDAMVFLYPDRRWAKAAWQARVPRRIGTAYRLWSWRFNRRVRVHRRASGRHEAQLNIQIAHPLIGDAPCAPPRLCVPAAIDRRAAELLREVTGRAPDEPYVVVHPGSSGSAFNWPPDCYAAVVCRLTDAGIGVVVTGGPQEVDLCLKVAAQPRQVLAGRTDLAVLGAVLARAQACVVGSTGPMHLAAALGRPVIGIFSPHPSHTPTRWGPLGRGHQVFLPLHEEGDADPPPAHQAEHLMRRVRPEDVAAAVERVWQSQGVAS